MVHRQHIFFLKRFVTVENFYTQRCDSAAKPDTLRPRANAMLDQPQPQPRQGNAFPLPDELTLGTNSQASTVKAEH